MALEAMTPADLGPRPDRTVYCPDEGTWPLGWPSETVSAQYADWLERALKMAMEYSMHDPDCMQSQDFDCKCDCGLDALRAAVGKL